jgi:hypothetical protein
MVKFSELDANDKRIEVLFVRSINALESQMLAKNYNLNDKKIPYLTDDSNLKELLLLSKSQSTNSKVKNRDFWLLSHSYLTFLNNDFKTANDQLKKVKFYTEQKDKLAIIYEVFSWDIISVQNENFIQESLEKFPKPENSYGIKNDFHQIILDYIAHRYYKNNELAKAFLVHNYIQRADNLSSLSLINDLESFYNKPNKSEFEKTLLVKNDVKHTFLDYVNHLKGVYYLHNFDPKMALNFFNKCESINHDVTISNEIFSNNTIECFNCPTENVMVDQVYKADVFSFIKPAFNPIELTQYLMKLEAMTQHETIWKAKLANYLLGNYYFNISNTGYYRGALTGRRDNDYSYFGYNFESYRNGDEAIQKKKGYNLIDISYYPKNYFASSLVAANYYKHVIELSTDKELNARCLYLIAKCELNQMYNGADLKTYQVKFGKYDNIKLPFSKAFYELKNNYSDTRFHEMIIEECSYFRYYSERF